MCFIHFQALLQSIILYFIRGNSLNRKHSIQTTYVCMQCVYVCIFVFQFIRLSVFILLNVRVLVCCHQSTRFLSQAPKLLQKQSKQIKHRQRETEPSSLLLKTSKTKTVILKGKSSSFFKHLIKMWWKLGTQPSQCSLKKVNRSIYYIQGKSIVFT